MIGLEVHETNQLFKRELKKAMQPPDFWPLERTHSIEWNDKKLRPIDNAQTYLLLILFWITLFSLSTQLLIVKSSKKQSLK